MFICEENFFQLKTKHCLNDEFSSGYINNIFIFMHDSVTMIGYYLHKAKAFDPIKIELKI